MLLTETFLCECCFIGEEIEAQEDCYFIKASQVVEIEMTEIGIKVDLYS